MKTEPELISLSNWHYKIHVTNLCIIPPKAGLPTGCLYDNINNIVIIYIEVHA